MSTAGTAAHDPLRRVAADLAGRVEEDARAVRLLCEAGLWRSAWSLGRSLMEHFLVLHRICAALRQDDCAELAPLAGLQSLLARQLCARVTGAAAPAARELTAAAAAAGHGNKLSVKVEHLLGASSEDYARSIGCAEEWRLLWLWGNLFIHPDAEQHALQTPAAGPCSAVAPGWAGAVERIRALAERAARATGLRTG